MSLIFTTSGLNEQSYPYNSYIVLRGLPGFPGYSSEYGPEDVVCPKCDNRGVSLDYGARVCECGVTLKRDKNFLIVIF